MENKEEKKLTLADAQATLQQVLMTLAKNAVHNQRLLDYADELERYIAILQKEEADGQTLNEVLDDAESKTE